MINLSQFCFDLSFCIINIPSYLHHQHSLEYHQSFEYISITHLYYLYPICNLPEALYYSPPYSSPKPNRSNSVFPSLPSGILQKPVRHTSIALEPDHNTSAVHKYTFRSPDMQKQNLISALRRTFPDWIISAKGAPTTGVIITRGEDHAKSDRTSDAPGADAPVDRCQSHHRGNESGSEGNGRLLNALAQGLTNLDDGGESFRAIGSS
jgi:hypothetical protein